MEQSNKKRDSRTVLTVLTVLTVNKKEELIGVRVQEAVKHPHSAAQCGCFERGDPSGRGKRALFVLGN